MVAPLALHLYWPFIYMCVIMISSTCYQDISKLGFVLTSFFLANSSQIACFLGE